MWGRERERHEAETKGGDRLRLAGFGQGTGAFLGKPVSPDWTACPLRLSATVHR